MLTFILQSGWSCCKHLGGYPTNMFAGFHVQVCWTSCRRNPPSPKSFGTSKTISACFVSYLLLGSSRAGMVVETKRMARSLRERCMKYIQVSGVLYHAVPTSCMFFVLSLFPLLWQFFRFTFILVPCRSSTRGERWWWKLPKTQHQTELTQHCIRKEKTWYA